MINIFRKIRYKSITTNKLSKYILYAFGEIILVVLGILIALQIDSWNDNKNKQIQKELYITSLKKNLKKDIEELNENINYLYDDLDTLYGIIDKLQLESTTNDTLIKIARYKFNPVFEVSKNYNTNTAFSLATNNQTDLLDNWLQEDLMQLTSLQQIATSGLEMNYKIYLENYVHYRTKYSFNYSDGGYIKGIVDDNIWRNIKIEELSAEFSSILNNKILMHINILWFQEDVLKQTKILYNKL